MGIQNIQRTAAWVILVIGLIVLVSVPVQAQDIHGHEEGLNWYQKLTTPEGVHEQFENNPILFFMGVFVLGIGVSLTPCILPMIPITVSIISGSKQEVSGRSAARSTLAGLASSLIYMLGVSITYALLGVLAAMLGVVVRQILQGCVVLIIMGGVFVVLGLSMLGAFSLPLPGWGRAKLDAAAQRQKSKRSLLTVFILGLISGVIASPCVAPVIGALLLWISTAGIWLGWWTLFVFGWGMGLLLIVAGFTGWVVSSGKWTLTVKAILGALLVLIGLWCAIRGIQCKPLTPGWLMDGQKAAAAEKPTTVAKPVPAKIEWIRSEPEGLALAKKTGKPVLIDFYADWCVYCRQMEQTTFHDKQVIAELGRFVAIKVDLTEITSEGTAAAEKYNVVGLPTFVFIDTNGQQIIRPGYIPPGRFLQMLESIK